MKEKEFRRNMAVFPIGSVMKLTRSIGASDSLL
ncbi:transcriptional repressor of the glutamine synthetase gene [Streptococcus pneumoniae]|nr:transcriptional repressor of the glutamine synthetase gene [Streptococcus pneumoniae]